MTFDFAGARFDVVRDRELLVWIFSQFLYGEVTGIQVGHWLYRAPTLDAANFLARQAMEELSHVDRFRDILAHLDSAPVPAHGAVRFLASGMMGDDWAEHVCLEMALGEGNVLTVLYALIDTVEHEPIGSILRRATRQEERHVGFGEMETRKALARTPSLRRRLLGLSLWSLMGVSALAKTVGRKASLEHPVLRRFPDFLLHVRRTAEIRLQRMGLLEGPVSEIRFPARWSMMTSSATEHWLRRIWPSRPTLLTRTYLSDERLGPARVAEERELRYKSRSSFA
ncbi:MAG: ferritin-like domain-containing protein [Vicinamibacteria bacterium]